MLWHSTCITAYSGVVVANSAAGKPVQARLSKRLVTNNLLPVAAG
jgi:hypothetical protein